MRASHEHPTAEDIYFSVREKIKDISLGTVYRNLKHLADSGKIKRITLSDSPDRFDGNTKEHLHVCCLSCGAFEDIGSLPCKPSLDREAEKECGYKIVSHETIFYGYCKKCSENLKIKN